MKESSLKKGDLFLPITFPILVTFIGFLASIFQKVCSTSTLKCQSRMPKSSFLGWISSFSVMAEMPSSDVFFEKRSSLLFWQKGNLIFVGKKKYHIYQTYRKHHITIYFLRKFIFHFPSIEKISYFREKEMSFFLMIEERSYSSGIFWKDHLFRTF